MIIKSKHHIFYYNYFKLFYAKWKIFRHFSSVRIIGEFHEKNLPILLLSNHVSWWDGIWPMYLNIKSFNRKYHFMMLEEEIKKGKVPNNVGGYSVKKGSRSIIESINYTAEILADKKNMVLLFPQGRIESSYISSIQFERGFDKILKKIGTQVQIFFLVNLVDYFSNMKPVVYMYFKEYSRLDINADNMQHDFNLFYSDCISDHLQKSDSK
jgi:1-acyl-sn-glycerol-3-phosphate acyltransferase